MELRRGSRNTSDGEEVKVSSSLSRVLSVCVRVVFISFIFYFPLRRSKKESRRKTFSLLFLLVFTGRGWGVGGGGGFLFFVVGLGDETVRERRAASHLARAFAVPLGLCPSRGSATSSFVSTP